VSSVGAEQIAQAVAEAVRRSCEVTKAACTVVEAREWRRRNTPLAATTRSADGGGGGGER